MILQLNVKTKEINISDKNLVWVHCIISKKIVRGPIDPIGAIRMEKGWAYGLIPSPRIRAYPRTINKGRNENYFIGRGKEYLWRI